MKWINFLHIYQLANADGYAIKEATEESYQRIISALEENPRIKFTINITGCLINRWNELGYGGLVERIKKLVLAGRIELVGSVSFHCLMPLVPEEEVIKQIKENFRILKNNFGNDLKLKGFFMPEMAYSAKIAKLVKKFGFEWIILDEVALGKKQPGADISCAYEDKDSGLKVVFRSRFFSGSYPPNAFAEKRAEIGDKFIITATDGELYGLRHKDQSGEFEKFLKSDDLETFTVSEFLKLFSSTEKISIIPCNWESTEKELSEGKPYFSWFNPDNEIQMKLWGLANLTYKVIAKFKNDENYKWACFHFSRGIASCTFWWASAKDFSYIYGPFAWNPDEIERGLNEFIRAIRSLRDATSRVTKIKTEKLYIELKKEIWEKHWAYYWRKDNWEKISGEKTSVKKIITKK